MKKQQTNLVAVLLVIVAIMGYTLLARAGESGEPSGLPHAMLETLNGMEETQEAMLDAIVAGDSGEPEKEYYFKNIFARSLVNETYFTVPEGKQFVLLKWDLSETPMALTVDDVFLLGYDESRNARNYHEYPIDIPDKCIVLNAGETLKVDNYTTSQNYSTIYGYFCDAE